MNQANTITLSITPDELERFCQKLLGRSRDITKTHDALVTLESFIAMFGRDSQGTAARQSIDQSLQKITEQSRQGVLEKSTQELEQAIRHCNVQAVANVHTPLSRNGFYEILKLVIADLCDDEIRLLMVWSGNWVKEARQIAQQASEYPDAPDFKKAGIRLEEFQAMSDIDRVLNPES